MSVDDNLVRTRRDATFAVALRHPNLVGVGVIRDAVPEGIDDVGAGVVGVEHGALNDASPLTRIEGCAGGGPRRFQRTAKGGDLIGGPGCAAVVNPKVGQIGTFFVVPLEGVVHAVQIVGIPAKGDAGKHTNGHHQHDRQEAEFGSPQAASQAFVEER